MTDKYFGDALTRGEDPIDLDAMTRRVLRRDRRRIWLVGTACVVAWMLVVMLPWSTVLPMLAKVVEHQQAIERDAAPVPAGAVTPRQHEQTQLMLQAVKVGTIATFVGSVASMFVAAVCTVCLVILSRRATLRQVNARLAEISAELKRLAGRPK
jgi:hypothetical protein